MMTYIKNNKKDFAVLIARIIIGGIFILSGWMKVSNLGETVAAFAGMGIPSFLTYIVSFGELLGGALIVLGLCTAVSALFLSIIMIVAVYLTFPMGYQIFITPLITLGGLCALIASGAGRWAIPCCSKCSISEKAQ